MSRFTRLWAACGCALVLLQASCGRFAATPSIDLDGNWEFRRVGEARWHPARVPGCAHTDLLANRLIPDPFLGSNESKVQGLDSVSWEYRKTFQVGAATLARGVIDLVCEGLDTYADVYLNDSLVLEADNMFRRWVVPCKRALRKGRNEIRVLFRPPLAAVDAEWRALPNELPGGPRVLSRKAAYQYGWDWAPRLLTSGIWRPIRIEARDAVRIADFAVEQGSVDSDRAELIARFEIESADSMQARLVVLVDGDRSASADVAVEAGRGTYAVPFTIDRPELWWTNGLGDPHLYEIRGEIGVFRTSARLGRLQTIGRTAASAVRRIGVRTLELVAEPDSVGESFWFELNGEPLYVKGANVVPQDAFPSRVSTGKTEYLVASAADASMNMLRVWGGGIYESDAFYDLCDEYGILVWQDFMFACAMYPGNERFLANVEAEAVDAVKRLRSHPCLALWCGNNETDEAWHNWGWQKQYGYSPVDSARIWGDYERLFHELLPAVVERYDPARSYVSSSPRFGRADPRSLTEGDCHYWGVWHDGEPFEAFERKVPRFMSEFGFQSFPSVPSMRMFVERDSLRIDSGSVRAHQKSPRGNELIRSYMERNYRVPEDFGQFAYVSQLLQADGIRRGIEAQRRSSPRCMGSLFWQLNDCWPAVSWSGMDWYGIPKALYYATRAAYGTVLVSPILEDDAIRVWVVSDHPDWISCTLELEIADFKGDMVWTRSLEIDLPPNSSACYYQTMLDRVLRGYDRRNTVLEAEVYNAEQGTLARNLLYFVPPKDLDLPPVVLEVDLPDVITPKGELMPEPILGGVSPALPTAEASRDTNAFSMTEASAQPTSAGTKIGGPNIQPPRPIKEIKNKLPRERERLDMDSEPDRSHVQMPELGPGHPIREPRPIIFRTLRLHAKTLVKNLYLSAGGLPGYFSNNYFDMLPGDVVEVEFITNGPMPLLSDLRIFSLVDTYKREDVKR